MKQDSERLTKRRSLKRNMFYGAVLAAVLLILAFIIGTTPNPGKELWKIILIPALMVPIAGAAGGAVFHFTRPVSKRGSGYFILANLISLLAFLLFVFIAFGLGMAAGDE